MQQSINSNSTVMDTLDYGSAVQEALFAIHHEAYPH
jgi:hypothetical protein